MITFYAVTPANDIMACTHETQDEAYAAMDRLAERGMDIFDDRMDAIRSVDRFHRQLFTAPIERREARKYAGKAVF
jgi:hypothetical protein